VKRWKEARQLYIDAAQPIADYELRIEQLERLAREGKDAPLLLEEPGIRGTYHPQALRRAYEYQLMTGRMILNPFAIHSDSLLIVDDDWVTDYLNFRLWVKYRRDFPKRPREMR
jgi:hypothetical protein